MKTNGTDKRACQTRDGARRMANRMGRFFAKVRAEASRFARSCDMPPAMQHEIAEARATYASDCASVCFTIRDAVDKAAILAAFTFAASLFRGSIYYAAMEDVPLKDGAKLMTIHITQGARP